MVIPKRVEMQQKTDCDYNKVIDTGYGVPLQAF